MRIKLWPVVLAAVAFPVVAAANPGVSGVPLLNPAFDVSAATVSVTPKAPDAPAADAALALKRPFVSRVGYRPRAYRSPMRAMPITAQFHVGFFYPVDNFSTGFDAGFRIGPQVDPHVQIGLAMEWWHRSDDEVLDLGKIEAPGGAAYEELILSESTANLVPILVFVQVRGDENMPVIPYGGFGVGYEWLSVTADDYLTHESFDQTYGGFGWQTWLGAALPLDWRLRLNAEVFLNNCDVDTEVDVYIEDYGPATVRDVVNMNGVGMRVGITWGF